MVRERLVSGDENNHGLNLNSFFDIPNDQQLAMSCYAEFVCCSVCVIKNQADAVRILSISFSVSK